MPRAKTTIDVRRIEKNGSGPLRWEIESSYNETFKDWLKEIVPGDRRSWDEDLAKWTLFSEEDVERVMAEVERYFEVCTFIERDHDTGAVRYRNIRSGRVMMQPGLTF